MRLETVHTTLFCLRSENTTYHNALHEPIRTTHIAARVTDFPLQSSVCQRPAETYCAASVKESMPRYSKEYENQRKYLASVVCKTVHKTPGINDWKVATCAV